MFLSIFAADEYFKTEIDTDISAEYAEADEDKTYHTETDGEIVESGSQENGKLAYWDYSVVLRTLNFSFVFFSADKNDDDYDKPKIATQAELGKNTRDPLRIHFLFREHF